MWQQIFLGVLGLAPEPLCPSGVAGLLIGLSVSPRYAGITHTADWYPFFMKICVFWESFLKLFLSFPVPPCL